MVLLWVIIGFAIGAALIVLYACAAVSSRDARRRERDELFREIQRELCKDQKTADTDDEKNYNGDGRDRRGEKLSD